MNDTPDVNLSSIDLTESKKCLLSKGLRFCPRPKSYDSRNLLHDSKIFSRRMRLKSLFNELGDCNRSSEFHTKQRLASLQTSPDLETFIGSLTQRQTSSESSESLNMTTSLNPTAVRSMIFKIDKRTAP